MREVTDSETRVLLRMMDTAISWWRGKKPVGWGVLKHLQNPTVNCVTHRERLLARAVARWYAIEKGYPVNGSERT